MNILKKLHAKLNLHTHDDELIYSLVAQEVENGAILQGLWTKAHAFSDFDERKAKAYYIRHRAEQLTEHKEKIANYIKLQSELAQLESRLASSDQAESQSLKRQLQEAEEEISRIERVAEEAAQEAKDRARKLARTRRKWVAVASAVALPAIYLFLFFSGKKTLATGTTITLSCIAVLYLWYSWADAGIGPAYDARFRKRLELGIEEILSKADKLKSRQETLNRQGGNLEEKLQQIKLRAAELEYDLAPLFPYSISEVAL
ncbi:MULTISPECIES: hypothetical protein [unclassified Microbulbifer]|uniref:hypothetical protein n=1 Tax=unclassified Microbulbifer TaxID=2619833 RepID=UPI0027E5990E|nr:MULTISPECIES: hypothetical protein [unclassified Microbulbifer]